METISILNSTLAGRYSVEREVGAGGMATVYVARDLKHDRRVALKVLDPELAVVLGADRFLSEIQVTAHLQHPNVLPLFDSGQAEQLLFYVMPFVEGESLRDRLAREKQLPIDEALRIATAIAGALDYAHTHGVIHRDLKPENILLQAGQPILADFGIALAVAKAGGTRVTQTGISLGTPQYMSPEQATGDRVIDGRSDIYSLGAVLYEMLTGDPPHTGSTAQAMIAKILTEPARSMRILRETVPEHVDAAVLQSLAKLPADRFSTGREFAEALAGTRGVVARTASVATRRSARRTATAVVPWLIATAAVLVAVARRPDSVSPAAGAKFLDIVVPDSISGFRQPALSEDGRLLAFIGDAPRDSGIFVRPMSGVGVTFLAGTSGATRPAFSKDNRWIAFYAGSRWHKIPVAGGPIVTVSDTIVLSGGRAVWTDEGDLLLGAYNNVRRYDAGVPRPVPVSVLPEAVAKRYQRIDVGALIPGTDLLLVRAWRNVRTHSVAVVDLRSGAVDELGAFGFNPRFAAPNHVVYWRQRTIFAAPLSPDRKRLIGPEVPVLETGSESAYDASEEGTMVFVNTTAATQQMVFVDRTGRMRNAPVDSGRFGVPAVSPDGRVILFDGPASLWAYDAARGSASRLPFATGGQANSTWSTDGKHIFYSVNIGGVVAVKSRSWTGTDTGVVVMSDSAYDLGGLSVGPPGTFIAGWRTISMGSIGGDLILASMDSMKSFRPMMNTLTTERHGRVSRDGKLLAYTSDESGREEVYIQTLPPVERAIPVSVNGGSEPVWARNGQELFYRSRTHFMSASLQRAPMLRVIRRDTLFPDVFAFGYGRYVANYDVMPGDAQFVAFKANAAPPPRVFAIVNWTALLKSAAASTKR